MDATQAITVKSQRHKTPFYRRLYSQLILLSAVVVAISVFLFTSYTVHEQSTTAREAVTTQSTTLTRNLGNAVGNYIITENLGVIEELIVQAAAYREVMEIHVTDERGVVLSHVRRTGEQVKVQFDALSMSLPDTDEIRVDDFESYIVVWFPIEHGSIGWVRLSYSLATVERLVGHIIQNGFLVGFLTFLLSVFLLLIVLRRPIRAIEKATLFASRLYRSNGETMAIERSTHEVEQLEYALNYAASRLYKSSKELSDIKFALDAHAIVGITDKEGRITYANDKFCEISGYSRGELLGNTFGLLGSGKHDSGFYMSLWNTVRSGSVWHGELLDRRKDGSLYWVDTTIVPFVDEHGKSYQYVAIQTDISERKQAEQKLHEHQEQLEDRVAERTNELQLANKELESFCYSVSHDLRAPLRSIDGFTQALAEDFSDVLNGQGMDYLARVRKSSQRMTELIDDLLELSRVVRSDMVKRDVNLSRVSSDVIDELKSNSPERVIDIQIQPGMVVQGDERLLKTMMENLLGNAWKFTSHSREPRIEIGNQKDDGHVQYYVRDNGAGFEQEYAYKLFEPFQRLHSSNEFSGSGIGLATVNRITRRHGGRIWAHGEPGKGAVFYFTLD
ncbi:MAG: ATP-binding protein [Granulosicoccaceae bacterium]|jgi:PAS domain S-box-containing protein